jgi:hypothetical protein
MAHQVHRLFLEDASVDTFEHDRNVIVTLPVQYARKVLRLLDNRASPAQTPFELRPAVAAAQRCPDVARFFLVEKLRTTVDEQPPFPDGRWKKPRLVRAL